MKHGRQGDNQAQFLWRVWRRWFFLLWDKDDLLELQYIVCNRNTVEGRWGTGQTSFNLDFCGCQLAQNRDSAFVWLSDRLDSLRKVSIVSQQSRDLFPCEILFRLLLVPPDIWVCNFQALLHLQELCPSACVSCSHVKGLFICEVEFFALLSHDPGQTSNELGSNHSLQFCQFSFQIRLENYFWLHLLLLMLKKCEHVASWQVILSWLHTSLTRLISRAHSWCTLTLFSISLLPSTLWLARVSAPAPHWPAARHLPALTAHVPRWTARPAAPLSAAPAPVGPSQAPAPHLRARTVGS